MSLKVSLFFILFIDLAKKGEKFFFNTKSSFYNFEEYLIDRVDKYQNEWYRSQKEKEENPGQYNPPKTIPPETNDFDYESYLVEAYVQKQRVFDTQPV